MVADDLDRPTPEAELSDVFDLGRSGGSDIAGEKDSMLGEAFENVGR